MQLLINSLKKIIDGVGHLCSALMILMIINVFYDVIMRYFFNDVSIAMQELEWHLFAAMFMFGIGYTLMSDAHVRVDVFYDQLSLKKQAIINILGSLIFALPFTVLILYFSLDYTYEAYEMGEGSADPGGLPHRWIIRAVIPSSAAFLILCIAHVVLTQVQVLVSPTKVAKKDNEK
ncbi:MAG: TRAP transporter small permease subunit [Litorilituus sp.]|nr:TRAP transporter small permease subunit [Litorilituus sp.]